MGDFNSAYDPTEVYSNSKQSGSNDQTGSHDDKHLNSEIAPISITTLTKASLLATSTDNNFDSLCTPCIASKQTRVVIRNKPMTEVNKKLEEQGAKLLVEHSLDLSRLPATGLKRKAPTGEPKPRGRPRKVVAPLAPEPDLPTAAGHLERSGPDEIINVDDDVNTPSEKIMSMTKTSSRVYEPKTYEEAITDPIHSR
ncbi:hypothetical protein MMC31_007743 [Peltigera leucophlebia]|nr:hypothetical protein [Peltigera leucophlebia]